MDLVHAIRGSSSAIKWVFRLHPADREFHFELERWSHDQRIADRIEVEDPTLVPIGSSLMRSLLHVTSYSSVIREAAMLGVHSIAWHPDAAASYPDLVRDGSLTCSLAPLTSGDPSELHMSPPPQRPVHPPLKQRLRSFLDLVGAKYPRHGPA
jgi:hypothetical protein